VGRTVKVRNKVHNHKVKNLKTGLYYEEECNSDGEIDARLSIEQLGIKFNKNFKGETVLNEKSKVRINNRQVELDQKEQELAYMQNELKQIQQKLGDRAKTPQPTQPRAAPAQQQHKFRYEPYQEQEDQPEEQWEQP
jgi:hypothetical protein